MDSPSASKKLRALSVPTVLFKTNNNKTTGSDSTSPLQRTTFHVEGGYNPAMTSKQVLQARAGMMPYRENGILRYMPAHREATSLGPQVLGTQMYSYGSGSLASNHTGSSIDANTDIGSYNAYDSDNEPLIGREYQASTLDDDAKLRFTATGRPMPTFKPSAMANMSGSMYIAPQHLPQRYTDESIIPVIVKLSQPTTPPAISPSTG
jgi:hypothetical protein